MGMVPSLSGPHEVGSFEFHGDTVTVISNESGNWAVLGQLCRNLTLDAEAQRKAILRKSWSQGRTSVMEVQAHGDNQRRPQFLLHERIVPMWLANITTSRIPDEGKREKVEKAQLDLADALYAYVTGRTVQSARREPSKLELARDLVAALEAQDHAERRVLELEPAARSWSVLADAKGDFSLRDAAHILNRDPAISTGQQRLMKLIRALGMVDRNDIPYAKHAAHLVERPRTFTHPRSGEETLARPQVRITVRGLQYLHGKLGGVARLRLDQLPLDADG